MSHNIPHFSINDDDRISNISKPSHKLNKLLHKYPKGLPDMNLLDKKLNKHFKRHLGYYKKFGMPVSLGVMSKIMDSKLGKKQFKGFDKELDNELEKTMTPLLETHRDDLSGEGLMDDIKGNYGKVKTNVKERYENTKMKMKKHFDKHGENYKKYGIPIATAVALALAGTYAYTRREQPTESELRMGDRMAKNFKDMPMIERDEDLSEEPKSTLMGFMDKLYPDRQPPEANSYGDPNRDWETRLEKSQRGSKGKSKMVSNVLDKLYPDRQPPAPNSYGDPNRDWETRLEQSQRVTPSGKSYSDSNETRLGKSLRLNAEKRVLEREKTEEDFLINNIKNINSYGDPNRDWETKLEQSQRGKSKRGSKGKSSIVTSVLNKLYPDSQIPAPNSYGDPNRDWESRLEKSQRLNSGKSYNDPNRDWESRLEKSQRLNSEKPKGNLGSTMGKIYDKVEEKSLKALDYLYNLDPQKDIDDIKRRYGSVETAERIQNQTANSLLYDSFDAHGQLTPFGRLVDETKTLENMSQFNSIAPPILRRQELNRLYSNRDARDRGADIFFQEDASGEFIPVRRTEDGFNYDTRLGVKPDLSGFEDDTELDDTIDMLDNMVAPVTSDLRQELETTEQRLRDLSNEQMERPLLLSLDDIRGIEDLERERIVMDIVEMTPIPIAQMNQTELQGLTSGEYVIPLSQEQLSDETERGRALEDFYRQQASNHNQSLPADDISRASPQRLLLEDSDTHNKRVTNEFYSNIDGTSNTIRDLKIRLQNETNEEKKSLLNQAIKLASTREYKETMESDDFMGEIGQRGKLFGRHVTSTQPLTKIDLGRIKTSSGGDRRAIMKTQSEDPTGRRSSALSDLMGREIKMGKMKKVGVKQLREGNQLGSNFVSTRERPIESLPPITEEQKTSIGQSVINMFGGKKGKGSKGGSKK